MLRLNTSVLSQWTPAWGSGGSMANRVSINDTTTHNDAQHTTDDNRPTST